MTAWAFGAATVHGGSGRPRRRRRPRRSCTQDGSGTVWVLAGAILILGAGVLVATLASVAVERRSLASAADMAALAAANALPAGHSAACARARSVARSSGAALTSCVVEPGGLAVTVVLEASATGLIESAGILRVSARAGLVGSIPARGGTWTGTARSGRSGSAWLNHACGRRGADRLWVERVPRGPPHRPHPT